MGFNTDKNENSDFEAGSKRIMEEVKRLLKPEFLNRIDELIVFKPLNKKDLLQIIDILLLDVTKRLEDLGMSITVDAKAKEYLLNKGTDVKFGARPLKRAIQKHLEDELAENLLNKQFTAGDKINVSFDKENDKLIFSQQPVLRQTAAGKAPVGVNALSDDTVDTASTKDE
jgi:ATP-dependent Clp protease ATP-binding subunit ClpC